MEEMLTEKGRQRTFPYDTKSPDYGYLHMGANAWKGIGKELKIIRKFYVSSRDVRIVCPRLNGERSCTSTTSWWAQAQIDFTFTAFRKEGLTL
jgi:hypothetical protein